MRQFRVGFFWILASFLIGVSFSLLLVPEFILHPGNIDVLHGDPFWHFLGWEFYREDVWSWPLTYTHRLIYPVGTTIVFTDSVPLLAIFLKLCSPFLPKPFNIFGVVCIINSSLMFYSGSLFLRVLRPNVFFNIIGGFFVLISSVFIWRFFGHFALTSQWLIIFELLLIMKPTVNFRKDLFYQLLLIFLSVGIHPYFVAMILPLSFALCWKYYQKQHCNRLQALAIFVCFLFFSIMFAWLFGWFSTDSKGGGSGFGYYSANLLTFINATYGSILLHPLMVGDGQYEGYAYLGLGLLISLLGVFFLSFYRKSFFYTRDYSALLIILAAYFLFALSDVIQIGEYRITLSHTTSGIWGVFRSSGRFIWPVFYFIQFFVLIEIYDSFSFSKSKRNIILSVLLLLQVLDNSYLIEKVRSSWLMPGATLSCSRENPIKNDFWFNLKKYHIQHLFIMDDIKSQDLKVMFTYVAFRNHITINDAYLARSASKRKNAYYQSQLDDFLTGKLLPNTLYIGLENKNIYPKKYCGLLDGYTVCSDNISLIFSLKSKH